MLTPEQKKVFLEGWIRLVGSKGDTEKLYNDLYQLLLSDTNMSGKLYKYRAFDKDGYSLKNLEMGTLYCACPVSFNDPFDCKIGVTLSSLIQAVIGPVMGVADDMVELFISISNGERDIDRCSKDEQVILNRLFTNQRLMSFLSENKQKQLSDIQKAILIKENPAVLVELLQAVMGDEFFAPMIAPSMQAIPLIMENITTDGMVSMLTKEPTYDEMAEVMGINGDADEFELSLQLSKKVFPEQEAEREQAREILDDLEQRLITQITALFRVGCMCTDFRNTLMWSHYADCHKGFCIEYDFSQTNCLGQVALPMPVVYSEFRPQIPWKETLQRSDENTASATANLMLGILTKDKRWEYENEWRFLLPATMDPNLQMPSISCIYLGAMISPQNRSQILNIARQRGIPVKQMVVDRGAYALHPTPIAN